MGKILAFRRGGDEEQPRQADGKFGFKTHTRADEVTLDASPSTDVAQRAWVSIKDTGTPGIDCLDGDHRRAAATYQALGGDDEALREYLAGRVREDEVEPLVRIATAAGNPERLRESRQFDQRLAEIDADPVLGGTSHVHAAKRLLYRNVPEREYNRMLIVMNVHEGDRLEQEIDRFQLAEMQIANRHMDETEHLLDELPELPADKRHSLKDVAKQVRADAKFLLEHGALPGVEGTVSVRSSRGSMYESVDIGGEHSSPWHYYTESPNSGWTTTLTFQRTRDRLEYLAKRHGWASNDESTEVVRVTLYEEPIEIPERMPLT